MKKQYLEMAKITKTVGLKGEVRAQCYCDYQEQLEEFGQLYLGKDKTPVTVISVRPLKNSMAVLRIEGINTVEEAAKLCGKNLYLDRNDAELPEDTWFIADLIGLEVRDADSGKVYGVIDEVMQNGPTDVYSIKTPGGKQQLFPAIPEVLLEVDVDGGFMVIRPLPNLFELEGEPEDDNAD